jgi:hypothetical protein
VVVAGPAWLVRDPGRTRERMGTDRALPLPMLFALAVVLVIMWGLGFLAFHVTTGLIHLLLLAAVVVVVLQFVNGRRLA